MKTRKNYETPLLIVERFMANSYVGTCEIRYKMSDAVPSSNHYPNSTKLYVDGVVGKNDQGRTSTYFNNSLDDAEKEKFVTTNNSGSNSGYEGIRKGWLVNGLVEVEVGEMQHAGQWDAYVPGSLVPYRNRS